MRVVLAETMGMCFGVRDALQILSAITRPRFVTIHGELVHNEVVLEQLDARGFQRTPETDRDKVPETPTVLITAHGTSDLRRRRLTQAGKTLLDTTCPLVARAHAAAQELQNEDRHVLLVGRRGHVEVQGIVEDLKSFDVIASAAEVTNYGARRLGILCQTTTPAYLAAEIRAAVTRLNPDADVRFIDTICRPTKEHQDALERLLGQVEAVVVVGGRHSNNTTELVRRCGEYGIPAYHVQSGADLQPEWFAGLERVGLTAGTSTLDETIRDVHEALLSMSPD